MSHCIGAFPQPPIMSDQRWVTNQRLVNLQIVHCMLVVTAAAWVPQMHAFYLHTRRPPLPNISYRCAAVQMSVKAMSILSPRHCACRSYVQDFRRFRQCFHKCLHCRGFISLFHEDEIVITELRVVIWFRPTTLKVQDNQHSCELNSSNGQIQDAYEKPRNPTALVLGRSFTSKQIKLAVFS